jgi:CDP-diacylglycerol--serine O-phosphatidyltransferase
MARPDRRPPRAAYALPTLFTAGNIFLGFLAIVKAYEGSLAVRAGAMGANEHFELAALLVGFAFLLDGLDGRIARMTNTVSDFGREMDSLADAITFGLAPAVLGFAWGVQFVNEAGSGFLREHLIRAGYFVSFLFLLCGCARLARFNVTTNPVPKNPGRPDRKYFVGLPIPSAAGMLVAVVYAASGRPVQWWPFSIAWLALIAMLAFLMVSTWRYRSFKDLNLMRPRSPLTIVLIGSLIYLIAFYSKPLLVTIAGLYVGGGIVIRIGGLLKRTFRRSEASA